MRLFSNNLTVRKSLLCIWRNVTKKKKKSKARAYRGIDHYGTVLIFDLNISNIQVFNDHKKKKNRRKASNHTYAHTCTCKKRGKPHVHIQSNTHVRTEARQYTRTHTHTNPFSCPFKHTVPKVRGKGILAFLACCRASRENI